MASARGGTFPFFCFQKGKERKAITFLSFWKGKLSHFQTFLLKKERKGKFKKFLLLFRLLEDRLMFLVQFHLKQIRKSRKKSRKEAKESEKKVASICFSGILRLLAGKFSANLLFYIEPW